MDNRNIKMPIRKDLQAEKFDNLLVQLDLDQIASEIRRDNAYPFDASDYKILTDMVLKAGEKWLIDDLQQYEFLSIEDETITETRPPIKVVKDLVGKLVNPPNSLKSYLGKLVVIDWKTSSGGLDTRWAQRYVDSWQPKIYLAAPPLADLFIFRGVNHDLETRQVIVSTYNGVVTDVKDFTEGVAAMRESLGKFPVWPQHKPDACNAFNRPCPYLNDCLDGTMPRQLLKIKEHISYSAIDSFLRCPERYRREQLEESAGSKDFNAAVGEAFHRGIAALYSTALYVTYGVELTSSKEKKETDANTELAETLGRPV